MPIFQDDIEHVLPASNPSGSLNIEPAGSRSRRFSEESLRLELCEGPIPDSPEARPAIPKSDEETRISDRAELIQRLKRGESPTWVPNRHVRSSYFLFAYFFPFIVFFTKQWPSSKQSSNMVNQTVEKTRRRRLPNPRVSYHQHQLHQRRSSRQSQSTRDCEMDLVLNGRDQPYTAAISRVTAQHPRVDSSVTREGITAKNGCRLSIPGFQQRRREALRHFHMAAEPS